MKSKVTAAQGNTTIAVSPTESTSDLNDKLWAINWFNMKWSWLHWMYMSLTKGQIRGNDGALYFKGSLMEKLEGSRELDRDSLLIVQYPHARGFLDTVSNFYYAAKTVLRRYAVRQFSFGFTRRVDFQPYKGLDGKFSGNSYYLVHVLKADSQHMKHLKQDIQHFGNDEVNLFFAGIKTAQVGRGRRGGAIAKSPFLMDGIILWESKSIRALWKFSQERWYQAFKLQYESNGIYLFKRER